MSVENQKAGHENGPGTGHENGPETGHSPDTQTDLLYLGPETDLLSISRLGRRRRTRQHLKTPLVEGDFGGRRDFGGSKSEIGPSPAQETSCPCGVAGRDCTRTWQGKRRKVCLSRQAAAVRRWKRQNPDKVRAHRRVAKAKKRGMLKPQPCEVCGARPTQAHHGDYARPLAVTWLCPRHHADRHKRRV